MPNDPSHSKPDDSLSIEDAKGEELMDFDEEDEQVVIATDQQGNSLTLLEEYARRRKSKVSPVELTVSVCCATASLAFAALIYLNSQ